jgi:hypothetical protein
VTPETAGLVVQEVAAVGGATATAPGGVALVVRRMPTVAKVVRAVMVATVAPAGLLVPAGQEHLADSAAGVASPWWAGASP